jgi:hypothetical protein
VSGIKIDTRVSHDFLRFARVKGLDLAPTDLTEVVEELIDFLSPLARCRRNDDNRSRFCVAPHRPHSTSGASALSWDQFVLPEPTNWR